MASYRRPSVPVYEVLMTPPVSPGHSEDGTNASSGGVVVVSPEQALYPEKQLGQEPQSQLHQAPILQTPYPHWRVRDPQRPPTPPQPTRSLENEQVHVEKPGVLKLTDFEVRGTLGKVSPLLLSPYFAYYWLSRYRHIWPCPLSSPQVSNSRISEHFCHEGSPES